MPHRHDIDREVQFHLDEHADALMRQGVPRDEAARQARLAFGGRAQAIEACRAVHRWQFLDALWADVQFTVRAAARTRLLTATALLALAVGVGATTTMFAIVNGVLLLPLPYADPERLVTVWSDATQEGRPRNPLSPADFRDLADRTRTLAALDGYFSFLSPLEVLVGDTAEVTSAQVITPGLFDTLGRRPLLGRPLSSASGDPLVMLSHGFWQRRFGGDPAVVGRPIRVGGQPATIAGVMPADFVFPYPGMLGPSGFTRSTAVDLWASMVFSGPMALEQRTIGRDGQMPRAVRWLGAVGRLRDGVSLDQARAELTGIARQLAAAHPESNSGWGVTLLSTTDQTLGDVRPALWLLFGAVLMVLAMATVNVSNLMLARSLERRHEQATRVALGAPRHRLVQQAVVESLLFAACGGGLGLLASFWAIPLLVRLAPPELPRLNEVTVDWRVAIATLTVSAVTGLLVALLPAFGIATADPHAMLQQSGRTATASRSQRRSRAVLLVAEVALAVVLTTAAGLLLRSFASVMQTDPGFRPERLLTWQMNLPQRLRTPEERLAYYRSLFDALEQVPGVAAVGGTTRLPLGSTSVTTTLDIEGRSRPIAGLPEVEFRRSLHRYFDAMGIPILRGRRFAPTDGPDAPLVAVVNRTLADRFFPGGDAVGQRVRTGSTGDGPWMEVVGVIGDVRHSGLETAPAPELYVSAEQNPPVAPFLVLRTTGDPAALIEPVRALAQRFDRTLPLYDMRTMTEVRSASVARRQFIVLLVSVFGVMALVLAAIGLDGVMAVVVRERTPELGVRLALGATPGAVWRMVVADAARLTACGLAVGVALSWMTTPLLRSQLFNVAPRDPLTLLAVPALLFAVAITVALAPALRAARTDPAPVLRRA